MTHPRTSTIPTILAAAVSIFALTAFPAQAVESDEPTPRVAFEEVLETDEEGNPISGRISFEADSIVVKPRGIDSVGGGVWYYYADTSWNGDKVCHSEYLHPTRRHSATAGLGNRSDRAVANPGEWARARVSGKAYNGRCEAYWSVF